MYAGMLGLTKRRSINLKTKASSRRLLLLGVSEVVALKMGTICFKMDMKCLFIFHRGQGRSSPTIKDSLKRKKIRSYD